MRGLRLRRGLGRSSGAAYTRTLLAGQLRVGEKTGSRKVRTPQGMVVGNADPGKPAGKCHRKDTAYVMDPHVRSIAGKGEMVR